MEISTSSENQEVVFMMEGGPNWLQNVDRPIVDPFQDFFTNIISQFDLINRQIFGQMEQMKYELKLNRIGLPFGIDLFGEIFQKFKRK